VSGLPGHIAVNAVFLRPRMGGLEVMVKRLLPAMAELAPDTRFSVFVGPQGVEALEGEDWVGDIALGTHPLLGLRGGKAISELTLLGWLAPRRGTDLLYSIALTGPLRTSATHVVNVADTTWITHPDPGEMNTVRLWRTIVPPVVRRADRVVAISEAGKGDIVRHLHVPAERIDVVYPGPGLDSEAVATAEPELRERLALGHGPIVVSVSSQKAHKNLMRLMEAMRVVAKSHPDVRLVLPGNVTEHGRELLATAGELGIGDNVVLPGWVSDEDMEGLYGAASAFVVASLAEGFGLPVVEAMRRGVPVASSNAGSLPEAGGEAARYFDPTDTGAMATAILALLDDAQLRAQMAAAGREWAATFSWERSAAETLESFERAWREGKRRRPGSVSGADS
jgi:glycosyltransferase involved in cell wall biosynthesis